MYWYPMALNIWLTLSRCYSIFIYFPRKINTKKTERQNYHQVITSLLYCCPPPLYHTTSNSCCFTNYVFDYAISNVQCTICIYLCVLLLLFRFSCHNFFAYAQSIIATELSDAWLHIIMFISILNALIKIDGVSYLLFAMLFCRLNFFLFFLRSKSTERLICARVRHMQSYVYTYMASVIK